MNEETGFLQALAENQVDNTTRLVYADWLDEHGETARAEFMRLWAAILELSGVGLKRQLEQLRRNLRRIDELMSTFDSAWIEQIQQEGLMLWVTASFRDALPEAVEILRKKFPHYTIKRITDMGHEPVLEEMRKPRMNGWYGYYENWPHNWKFDLEKTNAEARGLRRLTVEMNPMYEVIFEGLPMVDVAVYLEDQKPMQIDGIECTALPFYVRYDANEMKED